MPTEKDPSGFFKLKTWYVAHESDGSRVKLRPGTVTRLPPEDAEAMVAAGTAEPCDAPSAELGASRAGEYTLKTWFFDGQGRKHRPGSKVRLSHAEALLALADGTVDEPKAPRAEEPKTETPGADPKGKDKGGKGSGQTNLTGDTDKK